LQADYEERLRRPPKPEWEGPEYGTTMDQLRIDIFNILRRCPLQSLRTERVDGRDNLVFDFLPAASAPNNMLYLSAIRGSFWINAEDRMIRRWIAYLDNTRVVEELYQRLPDGSWRGKQFYLNTLPNPRLFGNRRIEWNVERHNYKRFNVGVEQQVAPPSTKLQ
jgi:hypothetical protein